jgi:hypothetical protein
MFPHPYMLEDALAWVAKATHAAPSIFFAIDLSGEAIGGAGVIAEKVYRYTQDSSATGWDSPIGVEELQRPVRGR